MILILLLIIFVVFLQINNLKLNIDYKSFRKKGFKKLDNKFGIICYTGKQGKGKTYSAVKFCLDEVNRNNYTIITNVKSFHDSVKGSIYMKNILDIVAYCSKFEGNEKNILIFFDEIFTCLEKGGALQKKVLSFLSQMRKRKILFITTAQEWSEINITFRRYVRFQVDCNMIALPFSKTAIILNKVNDGDLIHWDNDLQDFVAPLIQTNINKGNVEIIEKYDTFETIENTSSANKSR